MSKFKVGDRVRIVNNNCAARSFIAPVGTETKVVSVSGTHWPVAVQGNGVHWCAVKESNIELVTEGGEMKPYQRKTYRLKKAMPNAKVGTLVQEECDDGTQPYSELSDGTVKKNGDRLHFVDRSLVEDQPQWFEEVFAVEPQFMNRTELDQWEAFKTRKKLGRKAVPVEKQPIAEAVAAHKKGRAFKMTTAEFVRLWNASRNYTTLMKKLGCTGQTCVNYRRRAIAEGYSLKSLKGTRRIA